MRERRLVGLAALLCVAFMAAGGCRTLESAKRQQGRGEVVTFDAAYRDVFAAALHVVGELHLTVLGQDEPEGYVWAQRRPEPLQSWEWIIPTPRALKKGLQQAATPGQYIAIYFYPVDRERVDVEIVEQRISPVGIDRLVTPEVFAGIARRLAQPAVPPKQ